MRDKKEIILEYIRKFHKGRDRAVFSRELQFIFQLDGRSIRRKISALRQEGFPICSDETGYYYAESKKDVDNTINRMGSMLLSVSSAVDGLIFAGDTFPE